MFLHRKVSTDLKRGIVILSEQGGGVIFRGNGFRGHISL
jgi:hypothetical protein